MMIIMQPKILRILGPVKNPSRILAKIQNKSPTTKDNENEIKQLPNIVTNTFKIVKGILILNIINIILADYDKNVYLVVTTLDNSCKYFKFYLNNSFEK